MFLLSATYNSNTPASDHEMLEAILDRSTRSKRRRREVVEKLLSRFGTFGEVICANPDRLREVDGIDDAVISTIKMFEKGAKYLSKTSMLKRDRFCSCSSVIEYCNIVMAHEDREQLRILFLDKKNALIADEVLGVGTIDQVPVYPREVIRRALELSASALILVHNHPSGDPTPSEADIKMTKEIAAAAAPLQISVHDHFVIGRYGHTSLRALQLM
ncbi:RadC family protein [Methylocystis iwaonis]|uniref:RadC family protein n=1 Tax=Methylocystis iwaonis TaxID=2885079 RepID=UPI002E7BDA61|nr:DNA repair protein RadC [Methylocystis iwaonis]